MLLTNLTRNSHLWVIGLCWPMLLAVETKGNELPRQKTLNNFATELLHIPRDRAVGPEGASFSNPRDGWVFFRIQADGNKKRSSHVSPRFEGADGYFGFARQVFRATSETARLTISDWTSEKEPGGPAGQELLINFIEVEPYLENFDF